MPFVHVRSLPLPGSFRAGEAVRAVSRDFAAATETDERHVTVTWEQLASDAYAHCGQTADAQPQESHPVLVEVFAPETADEERIAALLRAAATAVAAQAGVEPENVFAEFRPARSGWILDEGDIARW